jgi:hypothetical protein
VAKEAAVCAASLQIVKRKRDVRKYKRGAVRDCGQSFVRYVLIELASGNTRINTLNYFLRNNNGVDMLCQEKRNIKRGVNV